MSRVSKKKLYLIERANKRVLGEPEMECPKATQDLELNTEKEIKEMVKGYGWDDKRIKADF